VIDKIVDETNDDEIVNQPEVVGHPVSEKAAKDVRKYMRDTVESEEYGTAYDQYKVPNEHVSAKTGTAQISQNGSYLQGDYLYSVVLMTPSEDPQYVMYLTMNQPEQEDTEVLPSIANPLLERAMDLNEVDESEDNQETSSERVRVEDYRNLEADAAASDVQKKGLTPVVIGDGNKVVQQSVDNGERLMSSEKLLLLTNDKTPMMPDVSGWSKADLVKLGDLLDVDVSFEGEGYCVEQSVEPYAEISDNKLHFDLEED